MKEKAKARVLRLPPRLDSRLVRLARAEKRSVNQQILVAVEMMFEVLDNSAAMRIKANENQENSGS